MPYLLSLFSRQKLKNDRHTQNSRNLHILAFALFVTVDRKSWCRLASFVFAERTSDNKDRVD
jgi:hypothetical protein